MTPEEKVAAIVAALGANQITFWQNGEYGAVRFVLTNIRQQGNALAMNVAANTGLLPQNRVYLPVDPDGYMFVNPPIQVPVDNSEVVVTFRGRTFVRRSFIRDEMASFKVMVYDTVTEVARMLGWQG